MGENVASSKQLTGYEWYKSIGSPWRMMAPMVGQSELAFRRLCRNHGVDLCYTPMFISEAFVSSPAYRRRVWQTEPSDRPLIAQFCGNNPEMVLAAAKMVEDDVDAIDLNLGCPEMVAKRGNYGSWMMQGDWSMISSVVCTLVKGLTKCAVTVKIRVFDNPAVTLAYVLMLQACGVSLIAVHPRQIHEKEEVLADWAQVRMIKACPLVTVPIICNGDMYHAEDVWLCLRQTGADGVMLANGLLYNPALFKPLCMVSPPASLPASSSGVNNKKKRKLSEEEATSSSAAVVAMTPSTPLGGYRLPSSAECDSCPPPVTRMPPPRGSVGSAASPVDPLWSTTPHYVRRRRPLSPYVQPGAIILATLRKSKSSSNSSSGSGSAATDLSRSVLGLPLAGQNSSTSTSASASTPITSGSADSSLSGSDDAALPFELAREYIECAFRPAPRPVSATADAAGADADADTHPKSEGAGAGAGVGAGTGATQKPGLKKQKQQKKTKGKKRQEGSGSKPGGPMHPLHPSIIRRHLFFIMFDAFQHNLDLWDELSSGDTSNFLLTAPSALPYLSILSRLTTRALSGRQHADALAASRGRSRPTRRDGSTAPPPWPPGGGGLHISKPGGKERASAQAIVASDLQLLEVVKSQRGVAKRVAEEWGRTAKSGAWLGGGYLSAGKGGGDWGIAGGVGAKVGGVPPSGRGGVGAGGGETTAVSSSENGNSTTKDAAAAGPDKKRMSKAERKAAKKKQRTG